MNIQAMMKQAQALQKDMIKIKNEIDNTDFVGESSIVKVTMKGNRTVTNVEIDANDDLSNDDIEMLQDMIQIAINNANKKIDETTEKKMGKFGSSIPGLF